MNQTMSGKKDRLYLYVVLAVVFGIGFGLLHPHRTIGSVFPGADEMQVLSEVFVKLIKMMIGPIIFCTVASGIAHAAAITRGHTANGNAATAGKIGLCAIVYFEVMSSFALILGLIVVNLVKPGVGIHANAARLDSSGLPHAAAMTAKEHLLHMIPTSWISALADGDALQVLLVACLCGAALLKLGTRAEPVVHALDLCAQVLFAAMALIMRLAPIGAFGAMAYTVGKFGPALIGNLLKLMLCFYATSALFIVLALGGMCLYIGISLLALLRYLRGELLVVLATSSSESALPQLMEKLEQLGVPNGIVRLVVPTGYSFNLDGTSIYLTMAAIFVSQALDIPLSLGQQLGLLFVLLLTSKGAAAVTGGGFITLASTLHATQTLPVAGLSLLLGIDRFMSEARAITNMLGNAVATLAVAKYTGNFDKKLAQATLRISSKSGD